MISLITILIWVTIVIIGAIAIIAVKLHYKGNELEHEEGSILPSTEGINKTLNIGKEKINSRTNHSQTNAPHSLSPNTSSQENNRSLFRKSIKTENNNNSYISPEVENNNLNNYEYKSQNQVLINYDNTVEKFQEPIKQNQMDIMTQNNKDSNELKDLFTIDELIKESKRKDNEREKESQTIKKDDEEDKELTELKESIKNKTQEPLIEEVIAEDNEETITDLIKDNAESSEDETPSVASQKDIDEAITTASKESEEEMESISEDKNITNIMLNQKEEEISEPTLKTPSKIDDDKDYKLGASIDDANLFESNEEDTMDLDYRKDLDKVKNKITGSKIFQEVKEKLTPETEEIHEMEDPQQEFIRNVNEYDEYEPIINETHLDMDATYEEYHDQKLRQENTKRVFNLAKNSPEPEISQSKVGEIKSKPARDNIKVNINNNEVVLKKGDEIIYNHDGETYSSQVYAINGDDIAVRYRGKNIKIKTSDVKKIY